jgi:hypothetical protein
LRHTRGKCFEEIQAIRVIFDDGFPAVTPRHHMVKRAGKLVSQLSRQVLNLVKTSSLCQE